MNQGELRPPVWQMLREAIDALNGKATNRDFRDYIHRKWGAVNDGTIGAHISVCTVNSPSRIHYRENAKPRLANTQYDFLYSTGRAQLEKYDPLQHGHWEIRATDLGKLEVGLVETGMKVNLPDPEIDTPAAPENLFFPLEAHLRDFIARNLPTLSIDGQKLHLFIDENGRDGVEYPTGVGPIDVLAVDDDGNFVVFELKLARGPDSALGQLMRYMGWVKSSLSANHGVTGVIVASRIDQKLKYAASIMPSVRLFEYSVDFKVDPVALTP